MRIFMAVVVLVALFAAFSLRAEAPVAAIEWDYTVLHTADLIALQEGRPIDEVDPAGLPVEVLFVPSQYLHIGSRTLLRDQITGIACAPPRATLNRIAALGDDFLVVRGILGAPDAAHGREITACQVVGYDGVAWEEGRAIEARKQRDLYRAGRL